MQRVVDGDRAALGGLYDRHGRQAYSLARRVTGNEESGEDVVQEAFLAFWRAPGRFDPSRGSFISWLLTIVHHKAVDAVRRERAATRHNTTTPHQDEEREMPSLPGADHAALGALAAGHVRTALAQLPAEQRQALALAYFGGYTQREVAAIVDVPVGTVKSRMFAGTRRLRGILLPLLGDVVADENPNGARHDR
ncbi:RNA polymerase sigma factor [Pseudonocardia charpentierae]|uniref:Sigma-70 family RNA polymerase sigma factor n=1 Tax=Pseudonocardia charpentierae TaxID=3075545 RepID=A0ABU2NBB9_9PSEU|nr:sigma-70 family RNA polymerase sigma factor [Pseudonocardia sp. DSM 45834]MDT0351236.1 sigma-70 family RNA polymerase sigma factor [Pseudonocardia sp. DSM 45834]